MTFPYPHRTLKQADYDEWVRRPRELKRMTLREYFAEAGQVQPIMCGWWPKACKAGEVKA